MSYTLLGVTRKKKILTTCAAALLVLILAFVLLKVDTGWCSSCGERVERLKYLGRSFLGHAYTCRLSWLKTKGDFNPGPCTHPALSEEKHGGLSLLFEYHPLFCRDCSRYDD